MKLSTLTELNHIVARKEFPMRAGTVLLFLVLIVIGFGFLLSSNLYIQQDLTTAQQQIDEIKKGGKVIEDQLGQANAEIANLKHQNEVLSQEKLFLEGQVKQKLDEYVSLRDQNARLQAQIDMMNRLTALAGYLTNIDHKSFVFALSVPLLPISLAGGFLLYRNGKSRYQSLAGNTGKPSHALSMYVTNEEMKLIRQMRRHSPKTPR